MLLSNIVANIIFPFSILLAYGFSMFYLFSCSVAYYAFKEKSNVPSKSVSKFYNFLVMLLMISYIILLTLEMANASASLRNFTLIMFVILSILIFIANSMREKPHEEREYVKIYLAKKNVTDITDSINEKHHDVKFHFTEKGKMYAFTIRNNDPIYIKKIKEEIKSTDNLFYDINSPDLLIKKRIHTILFYASHLYLLCTLIAFWIFYK